jgi:hypothetical protein
MKRLGRTETTRVKGARLVEPRKRAKLFVEEGLIARAQRLGCHRSGEEAVTAALLEYVHLREQKSTARGYGDLEEKGR